MQIEERVNMRGKVQIEEERENVRGEVDRGENEHEGEGADIGESE